LKQDTAAILPRPSNAAAALLAFKGEAWRRMGYRAPDAGVARPASEAIRRKQHTKKWRRLGKRRHWSPNRMH